MFLKIYLFKERERASGYMSWEGTEAENLQADPHWAQNLTQGLISRPMRSQLEQKILCLIDSATQEPHDLIFSNYFFFFSLALRYKYDNNNSKYWCFIGSYCFAVSLKEHYVDLLYFLTKHIQLSTCKSRAMTRLSHGM